MNATGQRPYEGFSSYKMDSKYRVSIQPAWRPAPSEVLRLLFSRGVDDLPIIKVLTQASYDERLTTIENSTTLSAIEKRKTAETLYMLCRVASLNEQGKLLIPKDLSERAGIEADSEVVLAGRGLHFEVWSKANHDRALEIEMAQSGRDLLGVL